MFEDQLQTVKELLSTSETFKVLHEQHRTLKEEIASSGHLRGQFRLGQMKKEKLRLKDQMATIIAGHTDF